MERQSNSKGLEQQAWEWINGLELTPKLHSHLVAVHGAATTILEESKIAPSSMVSDLVLAGALIHDVGKMVEEPLGSDKAGRNHCKKGFNLILEARLGDSYCQPLAKIALFHHCTNYEELTLPELIVALANETVNGRDTTYLEQTLIEKLKGHKK